MADIGFKLNGDNSGFRAMIDSSHNMVTKFNGMLGTIGLGISAAAVIGFFKGVTDQAGKIKDLSDRLGVSTDALQALEFHAKLAGGSLDQVAGVFDKTRKSVDLLMAGNEAAKETFKTLGLSAKDFVGLGVEQYIEVISRAWEASTGVAGAYDAVTDVMGTKTMPKLNAVLLQYGAEGAQAFIDKTREMGVIAGGETIEKLDTIGDRFTTISAKAQKSGMELVVWLDKWNEKAGNFIKTLANAVGIESGPFAKVAEQTKTAHDNMERTIPVVVALADYEEKLGKEKLKQSELADKALSHQERLNKFMAEAFELQAQMANLGITDAARKELNLKREALVTKMMGEQNELDKEKTKLAEGRDDLLNKEVERQRELLPLKQQRIDILGQISTLDSGINAIEGDSLEKQKMQKQLAEARVELGKVDSAIKKEQIELAKLLLIPAEKLTAEEKIRLDLLTGVVTQKQLDAEFTRLAAGAVAGTLLPAEKERLAALVGSSEEYAKQLASAAGITEKAKEFVLTLGRKGDSYDQQSTDALEGVRDRIKSQLDAARRQNAAAPRSQYNPIEVSLASEYQQIMNELSARQNVGDYANKFGETKARGRYGDELTDRALRDWTEQQTRTTTALEDIQQRLQLLFPKK